MGMATAAALESSGLLESAHVSVCLSPGPTARVLTRIAGPRVTNRLLKDIPPARIHAHPWLAIAAHARRRLLVTTKETGAPASALTVPSRCPQAIIEAIESLADDPARLDKLLSAGLAEAAERNSAAYAVNVVNSFGELISRRDGSRNLSDYGLDGTQDA